MELRFTPETMQADLLLMQGIALIRKEALRSLAAIIRRASATEVDAKFHRLAEQAMDSIECTACGNCCRNLEPAMVSEEALRLGRTIQPADPMGWVEAYTETDPAGTYRVMRSAPCAMLNGTRCSVYAIRPSSCQDYPHLTSPGQKYRFRSTLEQYSVCPIVFRTVETLLTEFLPEKDEDALPN